MTTNDNFDDYIKKINKVNDLLGRQNLPKPDHKETLDELIAEGNRLLALEEKLSKKMKKAIVTEEKKLEIKLATNSSNPYVRARIDILNKMSEVERSIIEKMEIGTFPKDSRFDHFASEIRVLGDTYSK